MPDPASVPESGAAPQDVEFDTPAPAAPGLSFRPLDPQTPDATASPAAVEEMMADPARREAMGKAGRKRAVEHFGWDAIARRTVDLYRTLVPGR